MDFEVSLLQYFNDDTGVNFVQASIKELGRTDNIFIYLG